MSEITNIKYKCPKCGRNHILKFQDHELCFTCSKPIHDDIHSRLKTVISYK